jgi:hypothetical protein
MLAHRRPLRIRHLAIRASDFVIPSSLGISSFVIVRWARRWKVALSNQTPNSKP